MSLQVASINSGSNGNCYYVGNDTEGVLIDAGISCREIVRRLNNLDIPIERIRAVFISHEHSDHIKGLEVLSRKYRIPVYITPDTQRQLGYFLDQELVFHFAHHVEINIGRLTVVPFLKHHDAIDPHSFIVKQNDTTVGVITDIGHACENVIHHFRNCNVVFLESNYDDNLLENGPYPYHLKKRIKSNKGHLSNNQAFELVMQHRSAKLQHLFLSHLSAENNNTELLQSLFNTEQFNFEVSVASRKDSSCSISLNADRSIIRKNIYKQVVLEF